MSTKVRPKPDGFIFEWVKQDEFKFWCDDQACPGFSQFEVRMITCPVQKCRSEFCKKKEPNPARRVPATEYRKRFMGCSDPLHPY
jgi:hypothetical protein